MKIKKFADSHASLFCLSNRNGMEVTATSIGATLVSIRVPDRSGNLVDVLLGYDSPAGYYANASAHGALVGRYANRIGAKKAVIIGDDEVAAGTFSVKDMETGEQITLSAEDTEQL